jgi:hypothetical protein
MENREARTLRDAFRIAPFAFLALSAGYIREPTVVANSENENPREYHVSVDQSRPEVKQDVRPENYQAH